MFYPDIPLLYGMVAITVVVLLKKILSYFKIYSRPVRKLLDNTTTLVIKEGEVMRDTLKDLTITREDFFSMLREK